MTSREILKARGVRLSDRQWIKLKEIAKNKNKENDGSLKKITPSDILRDAIDEINI